MDLLNLLQTGEKVERAGWSQISAAISKGNVKKLCSNDINRIIVMIVVEVIEWLSGYA